MGKIVVLEGTDFSGKTTQYEKLLKRLDDLGVKYGTDSFPNYSEDSSYFVRAYLHGEFGNNPNDIDSKVASSFYTLDRYVSFMKHSWGNIYRSGGNVVFARYITSNVLHQAAKLDNFEDKKKFIDWLYDFECGMYHLPKEDCVILLDMPPEKAQELKQKRLIEQHGLTSSGGVIDIHENDKEYLRKSYETAKEVSEYLGWNIVSCVDGDRIKSIDEIHDEIFKIVSKVFCI